MKGYPSNVVVSTSMVTWKVIYPSLSKEIFGFTTEVEKKRLSFYHL